MTTNDKAHKPLGRPMQTVGKFQNPSTRLDSARFMALRESVKGLITLRWQEPSLIGDRAIDNGIRSVSSLFYRSIDRCSTWVVQFVDVLDRRRVSRSVRVTRIGQRSSRIDLWDPLDGENGISFSVGIKFDLALLRVRRANRKLNSLIPMMSCSLWVPGVTTCLGPVHRVRNASVCPYVRMWRTIMIFFFASAGYKNIEHDISRSRTP